MTSAQIHPQIHPEELIDRSRHGLLGDAEQRLLRHHLAECPACRFELALAPGLYAHVKLNGKDQALISGVIAKMKMARVERREVARSGRRVAAVATIVAAFLAVAATASAGIHAWRRHVLAGATLEDGELGRRHPTSSAHGQSVPTSAPPLVEQLGSTVEVMGAAQNRLAPEPERRSRAEVRLPEHAHRSRILARIADNGCAVQFRRANELRRAGAAGEALTKYKELRRSCAGAGEELLSRVLIGRLCLDQLDEPALALAAFDSYLGAASSGALREDGMIGRALALGQLHRWAAEAAAWRGLLSAFPDSLYAGQARARLRAEGR